MLFPPTISGDTLRPTYLFIDLHAIGHNYAEIQKRVGHRPVMCILKANAYGHGLVRVAQHLEQLNAPYFGVAYLEEGMMLREAGIKTPILVLGGISGSQIPMFLQYQLTITASSIDKLMQIEKTAARLGIKAIVHLKIDTGMERIGIHYYNAEALIRASLSCKHVLIEGIFSHLANADDIDPAYSMLQINRFSKVLQGYRTPKDRPQWIHIANSAAILNLPQSYYNMVRCGILLYGIKPNPQVHSDDPIQLRPSLSWKTHIVYFKVVRPDHPVSYGSKWSATQETRVITLPVGYGDGYMRSMSGKAKVILRNKRYPVIGAICMDQIMVDIGQNTGYNGDEVILIGTQGKEQITVGDLAAWADTLPYEILTNINTRVPRIYEPMLTS